MWQGGIAGRNLSSGRLQRLLWGLRCAPLLGMRERASESNRFLPKAARDVQKHVAGIGLKKESRVCRIFGRGAQHGPVVVRIAVDAAIQARHNLLPLLRSQVVQRE